MVYMLTYNYYLKYIIRYFSLSLAQFTVHVRRPGVIALQNVHDSNRWLAILDGKLIGTVSNTP